MREVPPGQGARLADRHAKAPLSPGRSSLAGRLSFVLLAFVGTWVGHTLEYLRIRGPARLAREMSGSVHLYMLPLGVLLLGCIGLGGIVWVRAAQALGRRLDALRGAVRRGHRVDLEDSRRPGGVPALPARFGGLWILLAGAQLLLYVVQENVEAHLTGYHAPGFGALLGQHWAAAPLHLAVAGVLAGTASVALRGRRHLVGAVEFHEQLLALLWQKRVPSRTAPVVGAPRALTPLERWGAQRWARPPPVPFAA